MDRIKFIMELTQRQFELVNLLLDYRNDLNSDEDKKTRKLITYLLEKVYKLDVLHFKFVGQALGLISAEEGD